MEVLKLKLEVISRENLKAKGILCPAPFVFEYSLSLSFGKRCLYGW